MLEVFLIPILGGSGVSTLFNPESDIVIDVRQEDELAVWLLLDSFKLLFKPLELLSTLFVWEALKVIPERVDTNDGQVGSHVKFVPASMLQGFLDV